MNFDRIRSKIDRVRARWEARTDAKASPGTTIAARAIPLARAAPAAAQLSLPFLEAAD